VGVGTVNVPVSGHLWHSWAVLGGTTVPERYGTRIRIMNVTPVAQPPGDPECTSVEAPSP
jgi:hypothetical protein